MTGPKHDEPTNKGIDLYNIQVEGCRRERKSCALLDQIAELRALVREINEQERKRRRPEDEW